MMRRLATFATILWAASAPAAEKIDFAHDVLPILKARCAESQLIKRVTSTDPDERMPPKGPPLTEKEVATLKTWIDQDVPWQDGFSFAKGQYVAPLKPRRPNL